MFLCDAADEAGGKLYVLGAGWSHLLAVERPVTMALAVLVEVPWNEANQRLDVEATLLTEDGAPVEIEGEQVRGALPVEVGRPPGLRPGITLNAPLAMSFTGLMLDPGGYVWELQINREPKARAAFQVGYPRQ